MSNWKTPSDLKYTKTDEWLKAEGDEALIGITDYAQEHLSDIVFVELPEVGSSYSTDQSIGVVESVKAAADIHLPAGGEVIAVNNELEDTPELLNQDPYDKGWIARIKLSDLAEIDNLMDAAAYTAHCEERE
ncbi:MAG: glycine cleavage system protein GcvH [Anaerolineae bacterium]|nr:glycine cleavage system protein GcvH [Anaerolineae bacterium]